MNRRSASLLAKARIEKRYSHAAFGRWVKRKGVAYAKTIR